jgi:hypothetical protein
MIPPLTASDMPAFEAGMQHERERISSIISSRFQALASGPGCNEFVARKAELQRILRMIREVG